jgi:hypothetical protein
VAIRAHKPQIGQFIVFSVAVDVVELQRNSCPEPFREATTYTARCENAFRNQAPTEFVAMVSRSASQEKGER